MGRSWFPLLYRMEGANQQLLLEAYGGRNFNASMVHLRIEFGYQLSDW